MSLKISDQRTSQWFVKCSSIVFFIVKYHMIVFWEFSFVIIAVVQCTYCKFVLVITTL